MSIKEIKPCSPESIKAASIHVVAAREAFKKELHNDPEAWATVLMTELATMIAGVPEEEIEPMTEAVCTRIAELAETAVRYQRERNERLQ